jgi:hypothetical protein
MVSGPHAMRFIDRIPDPADLRRASVVSAAAGELADKQIEARRAAAVARCMGC